MRRIDPVHDLRGAFGRVQKPGRYVGGEFGAIVKPDAALTVAISYPDLYEIGMSNAAVKLIYGLLNRLDGVCCERVFAPAPDFEAELRAGGVPLYSLETGRPLADFDILGFSLGYELTLTNLLAILETGGIRLEADGRGEQGPIVIAGGPAATNPAPYGPFVDCLFVGEAEGWIEPVFGELARMKARGAGRSDMLEVLRRDPCIWHPGKREPVRRALWRGFARTTSDTRFPVPSLRVVQDHGTVEIMRGCPNSCRFCHAAAFYRPCRQKSSTAIREETRALVQEAGYRQITLSSLSSGDYRGIQGLVGEMNALYSPLKVSFSLPSLRVDSLGLQILAEISEVRKSGLTFAVETAKPEWQAAVRKTAGLEKVIGIMREAKSLGWRAAKFYFMVGLPASFTEEESSSIVEYLRAVRAATGMSLNVNVASFIPKPHTPYEREAQLAEGEALARIMAVVKGLKLDGFKVGYHAPFLSLLEGVISRGDLRAGMLSLEAYRRGARLDAWEEHFRSDIWRAVIAEAGWDVMGETCRGRGSNESLPWEQIGLSLSRSSISDRPIGEEVPAAAPLPAAAVRAPAGMPLRLLFGFRKEGPAAFISHLDLMTVFERALQRAAVHVSFTEGFNPKPRLEFASPLGLGIESDEEIAGVILSSREQAEGFRERMNRALPAGIEVTRAELAVETPGKKRRSLMSLYWGSEYRVDARTLLLPLGGPSIRKTVEEAGGSSSTPIRRLRTLAAAGSGQGVSYFEALDSSALS
jgi:radical SAM-linked protein